MKFSIIIPAHNEERFIGGCLESIETAGEAFHGDFEAIVVLNRCDDATEKIALERGARIVREDARCIAKIRNAGAKAATGEIIVTIDADSRMSPNALLEIDSAISSGKVIGGGAYVVLDRQSLGLFVSAVFLYLVLLLMRLSGGIYFCLREDFAALGGFNEEMTFGEDLDFAARLKRFGKAKGKRYKTLWKVRITTSSRKFDKFGDWYMFKLLFSGAKSLKSGYKDQSDEIVNGYFYDFDNNPGNKIDNEDNNPS